MTSKLDPPVGQRIFVDTNILAYAMDRGDLKRRTSARSALRRILRTGTPVISTQVLQELYVTAVQKLQIEPLVARRALDLFGGFEVLTISPEAVRQAVDCSILNRLSLWDALIVTAAKLGLCATLWSEDLSPGQVIEGVRVVNPLREA